MVLVGRVLATDCQSITGALLDFWHADGTGAYDNAGYRCRGHQFTDGDGRFHLTTVAPGGYPGRTRHIHVKVQARGGPLLTTQLYFPGERQNRADPLFRRDLLVAVGADPAEGGMLARFDFVLRPR
jgi:protocatechuate 3,4-dioxygenase beta subunit